MAQGNSKKKPTAEQKAARKARKRQIRQATQLSHAYQALECGIDITTSDISSPSLTRLEATPSNIITGTTTHDNQALQTRRWLLNERDSPVRRFAVAAIHEVLPVFDKNPIIRTTHPFAALSPEGKRIVAAVEREREEARLAGLTGDWWEGERKKGVTEEEAKLYKAARNMVKALEIGDEEMLGMEGWPGGLGAMVAGEMGLGPGGSIGFDYEGFDDEDDHDDDWVVSGVEMAGKRGEMEGVEEGVGKGVEEGVGKGVEEGEMEGMEEGVGKRVEEPVGKEMEMGEQIDIEMDMD
ncbi:MAG: hypothetical protein LQ343_006690 [Gyalolechia ehrenbergii]|nr:MAG: hypothetical protein LQ343_006690 [Gyalolechia ehrenbergii]